MNGIILINLRLFDNLRWIKTINTSPYIMESIMNLRGKKLISGLDRSVNMRGEEETAIRRGFD